MTQPQIYKGDPRPRIPPRVMASSAMGTKLGGIRILRKHTLSCSDPSSYAPDESRLFWSQKKPRLAQVEPHAGIEMAQVLGSPLYICGFNTMSNKKTIVLHDCVLILTLSLTFREIWIFLTFCIFQSWLQQSKAKTCRSPVTEIFFFFLFYLSCPPSKPKPILWYRILKQILVFKAVCSRISTIFIFHNHLSSTS